MAKLKAWNGEEPEKVVCSDSRRSALWHCILFHLPAVAVTSTLLGLYIAKARWSPLHPTSDELSALQYAAKAHEAFFLISITDILLHRVQYCLVEGKGIPLGFITSAFHIGSPVNYLFSWEFWSALLYPLSEIRSHAITSTLIGILAILALGAGPFSATLMIPRQGWWEYNVSSLDPTYTEYIHGNPYALHLGSAHGFQCNPRDQSLICNDLDMVETLQGFRPIISRPPWSPRLSNISYDTSRSTVRSTYDRPVSLSVTGSDFFSTIGFATCPMSFVAESMSDNMNYHQMPEFEKIMVKSKPQNLQGTGRWKQPLVAIECSASYLSEDSPDSAFTFGKELYDNYVVDLGPQIYADLRKSLSQHNNSAGPLDPIFLNLRNETRLPISAAFLLPYVDIQSQTTENGDVENKKHMSSGLCLVQARWVEADVWIGAELGSVIQNDLGISPDSIIQYMHETSGVDNVIEMTDEFLQGISIPHHGVLNKTSNLLYKETSNLCAGYIGDSPRDLQTCLTIVLSVYFADALARLGRRDIYSTYDPGTRFFSLGPDDILFQRILYFYGYAYRFQDSTVIILAFSAVLLHAVIAFAHFTIIVFSRKPWSSTSWQSFGKIFVLAFQSKAPPELKSVSGGVSSSQTWKRVVVVREVGSEGQLHLVLDNTDENGWQSRDGSDGDASKEAKSVMVGMKYS
ncbi:hypothetical protein EDB81DRAFT_922834, partial [Dactylonectria macrodidyma]